MPMSKSLASFFVVNVCCSEPSSAEARQFCVIYSINSLVRRNCARQGAPSSAGDGVVTYSEPSIAGATQYCAIYSINIASPKEKNRYFSSTAVL